MTATPFVLTAATTYLHGYDLTSDNNKLAIKYTAADLDVTTFGSSGAMTRIAGLRDVEADYEGFWGANSGGNDAEFFPDLGTADRVFTVSKTGTAGDTALLFQAGKFTVDLFGEVGQPAPFALTAMGTSAQGLVRGGLAKAKGNVSATGALGSVLNLGAVSATQYLYATVHIFTAGTTITLQLQTDDNSGFTSPTTVQTIGPLTTTGGTWATRVAGALTDTYQRINVSAVTGTFSIAAAIGVA